MIWEPHVLLRHPQLLENIMSYQIIDSDRHVVEPPQMWKEYLPKRYHEYVPYFEPVAFKESVNERIERLGWKGTVPLLPLYMMAGHSIFNKWGEALQIEAALQSQRMGSQIQKGAAPEHQIQSMDEAGIVKAHLLPTYGSFIVNSEHVPSEVSSALARAYNTWLYKYCAYNPERLKGVGVISRHDPTSMIAELEQIMEYGWTSVVLRPEVIMGRVVGHPDYEPFWEACESRNVSIAFHGGTHLQAPTAGTERFETRFALHACSHPMEAQMAFLSLLESGVLERHPHLRFAFLEAGAGWVPYWLWRLDEICYGPMPGEVEKHVTMKPSEYFKRQCWVAFEIGEPGLAEVVQTIGADRLLYGTDFPHPDHLHFELGHLNQDIMGLSSAQLKMALEVNPKDFFGD